MADHNKWIHMLLSDGNALLPTGVRQLDYKEILSVREPLWLDFASRKDNLIQRNSSTYVKWIVVRTLKIKYEAVRSSVCASRDIATHTESFYYKRTSFLQRRLPLMICQVLSAFFVKENFFVISVEF